MAVDSITSSTALVLQQLGQSFGGGTPTSSPTIPLRQTDAVSPNFNVNTSSTTPTQKAVDDWNDRKKNHQGNELINIEKLSVEDKKQLYLAINADAKTQYTALMKLDAKDRQAYAQSLPQAVKDRVNEFIVADTASAANDAAKLQAMMQFAISVGTLVHQLVTKRAYGGAVQDTINRSSQMLAQTIAPVKTGVELISGASAGVPTTPAAPVAKPAQAS